MSTLLILLTVNTNGGGGGGGGGELGGKRLPCSTNKTLHPTSQQSASITVSTRGMGGGGGVGGGERERAGYFDLLAQCAQYS